MLCPYRPNFWAHARRLKIGWCPQRSDWRLRLQLVVMPTLLLMLSGIFFDQCCSGTGVWSHIITLAGLYFQRYNLRDDSYSCSQLSCLLYCKLKNIINSCTPAFCLWKVGLFQFFWSGSQEMKKSLSIAHSIMFFGTFFRNIACDADLLVTIVNFYICI
jgi:hypothetical protein